MGITQYDVIRDASKSLFSSIATDGSNTTLVDANANLDANLYANQVMQIISASTGQIYQTKIVSHTETTFTLDALSDSYSVGAADRYQIFLLGGSGSGMSEEDSDNIATIQEDTATIKEDVTTIQEDTATVKDALNDYETKIADAILNRLKAYTWAVAAKDANVIPNRDQCKGFVYYGGTAVIKDSEGIPIPFPEPSGSDVNINMITVPYIVDSSSTGTVLLLY